MLTDSDRKGVALIIIDVQNDFGDKSLGTLYVKDGELIVDDVNKLRAELTGGGGGVGGGFIFLTQDWHPIDHVSFSVNNDNAPLFSLRTLADGTQQVMWPAHCVQDTFGAAFLPSLHRETDDDIIIRKGCNKLIDSYSGFGSPVEGGGGGRGSMRRESTELETKLRAMGVKKLVIVGLAFDYCVSFTARDARELGFQVCVARYATKGISHDSIERETLLGEKAGVIFADTLQEVVDFCKAMPTA